MRRTGTSHVKLPPTGALPEAKDSTVSFPSRKVNRAVDTMLTAHVHTLINPRLQRNLRGVFHLELLRRAMKHQSSKQRQHRMRHKELATSMANETFITSVKDIRQILQTNYIL